MSTGKSSGMSLMQIAFE
jgi:hypothetical protein